MADSLALITTTAGRQEILDADAQGFDLPIVAMAVGSTGWTPSAAATALQGEQERVPFASAKKVDALAQLTLNAVIDSDAEYWVREVGFYSDTGTLVFVWSHPTQSLGYKSALGILLLGIAATITDVPLDAITLVDQGQPLELSLASLESTAAEHGTRIATLEDQAASWQIHDTAADLRAAGIPADPTAVAVTRAAAVAGDNGGIVWDWYPFLIADDDGTPGGILRPTGVDPEAPGRWVMRVEDGTVYVECWGLPLVPGTENEAGHWSDAGKFAWSNGYPLVTLRKQRDEMRLWGVLPFSNVTYDLCNSLFRPYYPDEPEGEDGYQAITIFAFGGHGLRVPDEWVTRYGLRSNSQVNPMIDDPTVIVDHRYLHPDSPTPITGVTWIEFKPDLVFDPDGYTAQTDGTSTLVPGQQVYLFRPRYIDAVDQSMACPNVVDYVDGETVHFRHKLMAPFARNPINEGTPVIFGGIATVPPNFMIVDSHVQNFRCDLSDVPVGPYIVNLWKVGPALGCSCTDFEAYGDPDGAPWSFALHPRGRDNLIGGLRKSGKRSFITGPGSAIANDQGNHNVFKDLNVIITNWAFEYLGGNGYSAQGHFGEHSSIRMRHMDILCPDYDENTPDYNGADLTQGSMNELVNVHLHNVTNSLLQFTQVNGWGRLKARDVRVTGQLQGPVFSLGLADAGGTGAIRSETLALDFDRVDVDVLTPPVALTELTPIRTFDAVASTDASIRGCTVRVTVTETGEERVWDRASQWGIERDGEPSDTLAADTWQYLAERLVFSGNVGLPEIRYRHFGVDILNTEGTKQLLNNRIVLPDDATTYFRFSINEPDQQCAGLLYILELSDPNGVGGTAYFQGTLYCADLDDDGVQSARTLRPTATEITLAAGTQVQRIALPLVYQGTPGFIPVGAVTLWRRPNEGTAGDLDLRGVGVYVLGGR